MAIVHGDDICAVILQNMDKTKSRSKQDSGSGCDGCGTVRTGGLRRLRAAAATGAFRFVRWWWHWHWHPARSKDKRTSTREDGESEGWWYYGGGEDVPVRAHRRIRPSLSPPTGGMSFSACPWMDSSEAKICSGARRWFRAWTVLPTLLCALGGKGESFPPFSPRFPSIFFWRLG